MCHVPGRPCLLEFHLRHIGLGCMVRAQRTHRERPAPGRLAQGDVIVHTEEVTIGMLPPSLETANTNLVFEAASQAFIYAAQEPLRSTPLVQDISVGPKPGHELCHQGVEEALRVLRRAHPELGAGLVVGHDLSADLSQLYIHTEGAGFT